MVSSRYTYSRWSPQANTVDEHHIQLNGRVGLNAYVVFALLLLPFAFLKGNSIAIALWSFPLGGVVIKLFLTTKAVEKESVLIIPAFGVQLQTQYRSGRVTRRFIPVDDILKPVLVERVSPMTCYWSLCLVMREEAELTSLFKVLRPPVKMLVPIWKALCAATDKEDCQ